MASADLNELYNDALGFAQHMLLTHGEFIPFGVSMDPNGNVAQVAGDLGTEHPSSVEMVEFLQESFGQQARQGAIRAAAVCIDMFVVPPGREHKSDAICVRLAHVSGEDAEVLYPTHATKTGLSSLNRPSHKQASCSGWLSPNNSFNPMPLRGTG